MLGIGVTLNEADVAPPRRKEEMETKDTVIGVLQLILHPMP